MEWMQARRWYRFIVSGLVIACSLIPVSLGGAASTRPDVRAFVVHEHGLPPGSVIVRVRQDATSAAINDEQILGTKVPQGTRYQRLHFVSSIGERIILPRFNGAARQLWLLVTVFPSASAATQAYAGDSNFGDNNCLSSPTLSLAVATQTCGYSDGKASESGMYVIGLDGVVEFTLVAFIHRSSAVASNQAARDATLVARAEAQLIHPSPTRRPPSRRPQPRPVSHPTTTPVTHISPSRTPVATNTPIPSATPMPTTPAPTTTPAPVALNAPIDVSLDNHPWHLVLTGVQSPASVSDISGTYTPKGKYVLVFVTAQNTGTAPATLYYNQNFVVRDSQGRRFSVTTGSADTAASNQNNLDDSTTTVQPTFTIHTSFLFDVAPDAQGLVLQNAPYYGDIQNLVSLGM